MYRLPQKLRSGTKGTSVLLSGSDRKNVVQRTLSAPSPSSAASPASKTTTMPPANDDSIDPALLAAIQAVVEKAVKTAVEAALTTVYDTIKQLQADVSSLQERIKEIDERLVERTDELEQYQRRNNLRLFGVKESVSEDTDKLVISICRDKLGVVLPAEAISRSHRVGRRQDAAADGGKRPRPIIVSFTTYRTRRMVFQDKKKLKGTGVTIREDLTFRRQELYRTAVSRYGVKNVWTQDGRVLWVDKDGQRGMATRSADLPAS